MVLEQEHQFLVHWLARGRSFIVWKKMKMRHDKMTLAGQRAPTITNSDNLPIVSTGSGFTVSFATWNCLCAIALKAKKIANTVVV